MMELCRGKSLVRVAVACVLLPVVFATGCGEEETARAIGTFRLAGGALAGTYRTFLVSANTVEEEHYIDGLAIHPRSFDETAMQKLDVLTPEQITLRTSAIKALASYTALLATLASGEPTRAIVPEVDAAGASVATLAADVQAAVEKHHGDSGESLAGPITAAASAAGAVLKLIEQHQTRKAIRDSILTNDPAIRELFKKMGDESRLLYARQKQAISEEQTAIVMAFDQEAAKGGGGEHMLMLGDRLKKVRRESALQEQANPKAAITAFQDAHDALIDQIKNGSHEKVTIASLLASAQKFADEVAPLATSVQAFVSSI